MAALDSLDTSCKQDEINYECCVRVETDSKVKTLEVIFIVKKIIKKNRGKDSLRQTACRAVPSYALLERKNDDVRTRLIMMWKTRMLIMKYYY